VHDAFSALWKQCVFLSIHRLFCREINKQSNKRIQSGIRCWKTWSSSNSSNRRREQRTAELFHRRNFICTPVRAVCGAIVSWRLIGRPVVTPCSVCGLCVPTHTLAGFPTWPPSVLSSVSFVYFKYQSTLISPSCPKRQWEKKDTNTYDIYIKNNNNIIDLFFYKNNGLHSNGWTDIVVAVWILHTWYKVTFSDLYSASGEKRGASVVLWCVRSLSCCVARSSGSGRRLQSVGGETDHNKRNWSNIWHPK